MNLSLNSSSKTGSGAGPPTTNGNLSGPPLSGPPLSGPSHQQGPSLLGPLPSVGSLTHVEPSLHAAVEEARYGVGDMVWSKLSGYPWWPCMISEDPLIKEFTKVTVKGSRQYHCQFFGQQAERGWVAASATLPFQGRVAFESYSEFLIQQAKSKSQRKNLQLKFEIKPARRPAWELAVLAAESAAELGVEDRKARYTFLYTDLEQPPPPPKQASAGSPSEYQPRSHTSGEDHSKAPSAAKDGPALNDVAMSPKFMDKNRAKPRPSASFRGNVPSGKQFQAFLKQRLGVVQAEHPDWTRFRVQSFVQCEWDQMMSNKSSNKARKRSVSKPPSADRPTSSLTHGVPPPNKKRRMSNVPPSNNSTLTSAPSRSSLSVAKVSKKNLTNGNKYSFDEPILKENACQENGDMLGTYKHTLEVKLLSGRWVGKKDLVCFACLKPGDLTLCKGPCRESYHAACANVEPGEHFKCSTCRKGQHLCSMCSEVRAGESVRKCSLAKCGRFYHDSCLDVHPLVRRTNKNEPICPRHVCASCSDGNPEEEMAQKGQMLQCSLCPNAYHVGDFCIPAGSELVGGSTIVCSAHFKPQKGQSQHLHVNVNSCFNCDQGGHLICCEACPAAYHVACAGLPTVPTDRWLCNDCSSGKMPRYGDIVWVKCGKFRWWPCEVKHFKNLPENIQKRKHSLGEFAVFFFGSHDYLWTNRARVYRYVEEDINRIFKDRGVNSAGKLFDKAIPEAVTAFKRWKLFKDAQAETRAQTLDKQPCPFKHITVNFLTSGASLPKVDIQVCSCKADSPCDTNACLNRALNIECTAATCPIGNRCMNLRFQKRLYPKSEPKRCDSKGWGLVIKEDIKTGDFVNEYVGEIISTEESARRLARAHATGVKKYYMFTLDNKNVIDAGPKGNLCRFMNNSCEPNCETQKWTVNGVLRIGLFALRDISAGEELTFNYHFEYSGQGREVCHCGSAKCCGILGGKPKAASPKPTKKAVKKKKRKSRKKTGLVSEDDCFRCGDGGDLVICDRLGCPKAYHLSCLQLESIPKGKWECPWHHCDSCGRPAVTKCMACPDSYCSTHSDGKVQITRGFSFCHEHDADEMDEVANELLRSPGPKSSFSKDPAAKPAPAAATQGPPAATHEAPVTSQGTSRRAVQSQSSSSAGQSGPSNRSSAGQAGPSNRLVRPSAFQSTGLGSTSFTSPSTSSTVSANAAFGTAAPVFGSQLSPSNQPAWRPRRPNSSR